MARARCAGCPAALVTSGTEKGSVAKNLVIVESPAKAKTINKYLGRDFQVKASMGHVRDLPKKKLGVDVKKGFAAEYECWPTRKKVLDELQGRGRGRDRDLPGRRPRPRGRGHLLAPGRGAGRRGRRRRCRRVVFNEITKRAVEQRLRAPGRDRREEGRRPAGAAHPRPAWWATR